MTNAREDVALIAVMGPTGCGKTTFVNTASDSTLKVGSSLDSCTDRMEESAPFDVTWGEQTRRVVLIDTPGFADTSKSDIEILKLLATYFEEMYKSRTMLAGIIYTHRISDPRMGGAATRWARVFGKLCGQKFMNNVVITTTFWSKVTKNEGETREQDLRMDQVFGRWIKSGADMMRQDRGRESAHEIIQSILSKDPRALRIQKQMVDKRRQLNNTDASQELSRALAEQLQQFEQELKNLDEELQEAKKVGNGEDIEEIAGEKHKPGSQSAQKDGMTIQTVLSWFKSLRNK